jgi:hypothetical protein
MGKPEFRPNPPFSKVALRRSNKEAAAVQAFVLAYETGIVTPGKPPP